MSREAKVSRSNSDVRIGFVELIDAAPLVAALELGYFADEGLRVTLERQIGWGNVRDKLVYGNLDVSHALVGMPPLSVLGRDRFPEPVISIMALGVGGNGITFGRKLTDAGINSATELARHARSQNPADMVLLAYVFDCSSHHYLLRDWLAAGGVDPDRDVRFVVLPPTQMTRQLEKGKLDGFCAGEPWNTLAEKSGIGEIVAVTTDVAPAHPEKVLAASRRWLAKSAGIAELIIRATLRGCAFVADARNATAVAEILSRRTYLNLPSDIILQSLMIDRWFGGPSRRRIGLIRNCAPETTFPAATHGAWLLSEMIRWTHLPADVDVVAIARSAVDTGPYRRAAETLRLACPPDDLPSMPLRVGSFDPRSRLPSGARKVVRSARVEPASL